MGVKKYTTLYTGAQPKTESAPTKTEKSEIEQLKKAIQDRFKNPEEIKKAARIIEEMLNR